MNKGYSIIILAAVALFATSCQSRFYQIEGKGEGLKDGDTLFITDDLINGVPTDTLIVKQGSFSYESETDTTKLCMVYCAKNPEMNAPFFLEPGTIKIQLASSPEKIKVSGTECNEKWQTLNDSVFVIGSAINKIAQYAYGNKISEAEQKKLGAQITKLDDRFKQLIRHNAEENTDNEFGYFLLTYYQDDILEPATRLRLILKLPAKMQQRKSMQQIISHLKKEIAQSKNNRLSDLIMKKPDGKDESLMNLVRKNKITVIDFWASWCGPCRAEMPHIVRLYKNLRGHGLGIIGISLDSNADDWKKATRQLNITWPQLSDLKGWDNAAAKMYNVQSIPFTMVVDKKGNIIARDLRGEKLEKAVRENL
jgi:thiol-disulfide isomerase/thioredoxin